MGEWYAGWLGGMDGWMEEREMNEAVTSPLLSDDDPELLGGESCGGVSSGLLEEEGEQKVVGEGHSTRGNQVGDRVGAVKVRWVVDFAILPQSQEEEDEREREGRRPGD